MKALKGIVFSMGIMGAASAADIIHTTANDFLSVAASDGFLYWTKSDDNLYRGCVNSSGNLSTNLVECGADAGSVMSSVSLKYPGAMAVGGGFVYWLESGGNNLKYGNIDLGGNGSVSNISTVSTTRDIKVMTADLGWVYWIEKDSTDLKMGYIAENSSGNYALVESGTLATTVDDDHLLAASRGWLFYKDGGANNVYKARPDLVNSTLTNVTVIASGAADLNMMATETGNFYHRENPSNNFYKATYQDLLTPDYDWQQYVEDSLKTLVAKGLDTYGSTNTNMIMANLDLDAIANVTPPYSPSYYQLFTGSIDKNNFKDKDGRIRAEEWPRVYAGRISWSGSNLANDYPLLDSMYMLNGYSGGNQFKDAADNYVEDVFKYATQHSAIGDYRSADDMPFIGETLLMLLGFIPSGSAVRPAPLRSAVPTQAG